MPCTDTFTARSPSLPTTLGARLVRAFTKLLEWQERAEQRGHLAGMDERMRKDIGISHADALREADKPFWRA